MNTPKLTEAMIRQRTTPASWERGWDYYEHGHVEKVVWRDGTLRANVQGSAFEPYHVEIFFGDEGVLDAYCTCPYDWGGDCKHIVAVLLTAMHHPDAIEERPSLAALIEGLNEAQLREALKRLVIAHPHLMDELEAWVEAPAASSEAAASPDDLPPEVNLELLRRQIQADLRNALNTGYNQWGESWYDSDLGAVLEPGLQEVGHLLEAGKARQALVVLKAMADAWEDGIESLDAYVRESFEDVADEFTIALGETWAEALLMADLSEEERESWIDNLEDLVGSMFGGGSLEIALAAAEQGWDDPFLVAAMEGRAGEYGAWEDEPPYFADELARIRLGILEEQGRYDAYLNLARAEGQFLSYLQMLVRVGRAEEALQEGLTHLTTPRDVLALARTLAEQDEVDKAIALARHGLGLDEGREKAALAAWLRDLARDRGRRELALEIAERALAMRVSLENYLAWREIAGDQWPQIRPKALRVAARGDDVNGKVDIFLHEGLHDEAIAAVEGASWFFDIGKVIEAVKETHPEWAFRQCALQAEAIMDAGQARKYDVAVAWLRRGRDILLAAGQEEAWKRYLAEVMAKHRRKYKLTPMLRALE